MSENAERPPHAIPWAAITAGLSLAVGSGLAIGGIFVLAGLGWSLLAGAVPCLLLAAVIVRGLIS